MNPLQYLDSLTPGVEDDLVYKYEGGQINFRSYLTVDEVEDLREDFFVATDFAKATVLFQALARMPDGRRLFPRPTGVENEAKRKEADAKFGHLNGPAIVAIAKEVGLVKHCVAQLISYPSIDGGKDEDPKTETTSEAPENSETT